MANEVIFSGDAVDYTSVVQYNYSVGASGVAVTKGQFFIFDETMPFTVVPHGTVGDVIPAGIAVEDRDSDDTTQDRIGLLRRGHVLCVADNTIAVGDLLVLGTTANRVAAQGANNNTASTRRLNKVIGVAKQQATAGVTFLAWINIA